MLFQGGALYKNKKLESVFDNVLPFLRAVHWRIKLCNSIIHFGTTIRFIGSQLKS
jgi:hypothetical protein